MKNLFFSLILCMCFTLSVCAEDFPPLKYKNIGIKNKISYNSTSDKWSAKADKKSGSFYIKTKGFGDFYDYLDSNKNFAFSTECEYEFIYNNKLIGYSNHNMKFYNFSFVNGNLSKKELSKEEVQNIFSDYFVISLSDFSPKTNSLKIKKHLGNLKILLFNDTDKTFDNYYFSSGNAKFEQYSTRGFLTVLSSGMIQFSGKTQSSDQPWYILLVR